MTYSRKNIQKAQSHCDIFRRKGVEMIGQKDKKWILIETSLEAFKPLFSCFIFQLLNFYYN